MLKLEKFTYFSIWILVVFYSIFCYSRDSYKYFLEHHDEHDDFTTGISLLSRKRDKSDFEWEVLIYLLKNFYPYALFYLYVAETINTYNLNTKITQLWQISFTSFCVVFAGDFTCLCFLLFQPIFFYLAQRFTTGISTVTTWFCTICSIVLIALFKNISITDQFPSISILNGYVLYTLTISICWMNLKCTSYFLENPKSVDFLEFLAYCFYPPTVFTGPFLLYEDYKNLYEHTAASLYQRCKQFIINIFVVLCWFFCGYVGLHYVYVNATSFQQQLVKKMDIWSLCGYGYAMGQFFHIKYVVLYGLSTNFASFERVSVPYLPRCIGRIHLYSDMWKYFDAGLYKFLLRFNLKSQFGMYVDVLSNIIAYTCFRHIYLPLLSIKCNKLIASLVSFLFVYIWHGVENFIMIWAGLNYLGIVCERMAASLGRRYCSNRNAIPPNWMTYLKCISASPLLLMSCISNFYFFAGSDIGNIFVQKTLEETTFNIIILLGALYCCCQVSTEVRSMNARKM